MKAYICGHFQYLEKKKLAGENYCSEVNLYVAYVAFYFILYIVFYSYILSF